MSSRRTRSGLIALVPLAIVASVLSGCATPDASPTKTPSATPTSSETSEPSATPTPTPTPTVAPIGFGCDTVLSADDIYAFNPNYGVAPDHSPSTGAIADAAALGGVACAWSNQTSGEVIEVAVAKPSSAELTARAQAAAGSSSAAPIYGTPPDVDGYFTVVDGAGEAQVFTKGYWLVARSSAFGEADDAAKIVLPAIDNLP